MGCPGDRDAHPAKAASTASIAAVSAGDASSLHPTVFTSALAENSVPQIPAGSRIGALVSDSGVAIGVLDRGSASLSTVLMERWGRGSC